MKSQRWQSGTALTLAIAMATSMVSYLSLARSVAAAQAYQTAQVFPDSWRNNRPSRYPSTGYPSRYPASPLPDNWRGRSVVPAGTVIPTSYEKDKIVVTPTETSDVTLTVASDVRSVGGTVLIPEGSQIKGELQPTSGGTQFVAKEVVLDNGDRYPIDATSNIITRREIISRQSNPKWLEGVAIGAVAASILGEIFGRIQLWQVLGGAGVGALGSLLIRNREKVEVIVIDPATDLNLRLQSDFESSQRLR